MSLTTKPATSVVPADPSNAELESQQKEAEQAQRAVEKVEDALGEGKAAAWHLAEALYEFDELRGWLKLGHETLGEWLADSGIGMARRTYERFVSTWRKLVVERQVEPQRLLELEPSKVALVVPKIVEGRVLVDDALNDAEVLGWRDLREKFLAKPREDEKKDSAEVESPDTPDTPAQADDANGQNSVDPEDAEVVAGVVLQPLDMGGLVKLARKRWHRAPSEDDVGRWMLDEGYLLPTLDAAAQADLDGALASKAEHVRLERATIMQLVGRG